MDEQLRLLGEFVFYYPLLMSYVWMTGGVIFYLRHEWKSSSPEIEQYPFVTILVPCHNEGKIISGTVEHLLELDYPKYEVVLVDDGSTDETPAILQELCSRNDKVRALYLERNQGKGAALNMGALMAGGSVILTLDADALLEPEALKWMVWHFERYPRVGAVTGNPRVINRTTLLGKIQTGEYSTIIGLIKRSQRLLGKLLTVSGVVAAFRKEALVSVGYWDTSMATDDIDVTWKLQARFWDVRFEPRAICWIYVPETLKGLWMQRLRWAQGGVEVLIKHRGIWMHWRQRRLWPIYLEYSTSTCWSYLFWLFIISEALHAAIAIVSGESAVLHMDRRYGSILVITCMFQFTVSLLIERKYDRGLVRYIFWVIWYPFIYWMILAVTAVLAVPRAVFKKKGESAVWVSPDRGLDKL